MGNGMVINLDTLALEIEGVQRHGIGLHGRFFVSTLAHLIMPYHILIDEHEHAGGGSGKIGSTGRGIGPCYADKHERIGFRLADLADKERFGVRFEKMLELKKTRWPHVDFASIVVDEVVEKMTTQFQKLGSKVIDVAEFLDQKRAIHTPILCEGAQATHLDIDFGTYPYVTSSHTTSAGVPAGLGIPPHAIDNVYGIAKAYTTRVGHGPFPTELTGQIAEDLRAWGHEYGATTGRPRRCGWFDVMMVKRSCTLNGISKLLLTKLDVLGKMREIKICYGYEGELVWGQYPQTVAELERVLPRYTTMPGWLEDISNARTKEDLPTKARHYIEKLEELVGIEIAAVGVGPEREATIEL